MTRSTGSRSGGKGSGGKPPAEHKWPKGTSGNPKGRPRKTPAEPLGGEVVKLILAEGFKPITPTEGGKPVTMPAVQAALKALLVSALKGNSHAARLSTKCEHEQVCAS